MYEFDVIFEVKNWGYFFAVGVDSLFFNIFSEF